MLFSAKDSTMFPFELMRLSGVACYDRILYQEIDYLNEGRNADRFRSDFRKQKWVKVPVSTSSSLSSLQS